MGTLVVLGLSKNVRRGSGVLGSISYPSTLSLLNLRLSNELPSSVRRCFVGAGEHPSSHKAVIDDRGITADVGTKLVSTKFRTRSVLIDRMSI